MMMRILKKCSKEILEFQDLPVPIAGEVYMTGEQIRGMLHISSRTLQKLRDEKGVSFFPLFLNCNCYWKKIIEVMFVKSSV